MFRFLFTTAAVMAVNLTNSTTGTSASSNFVSSAFLSSQSYSKLSEQFLQYHKDPTNVFLHLLSTPTAVLGVLVMISAASNSKVAVGVCFAHQVLLSLTGVPLCAWFGTTLVLGFLLFVAHSTPARFPIGLGLFTLGFAGQSVAHLYTGEASFASSYQTAPDYLGRCIEHTLLLLPLVLEAADKALNSTQWLLLAASVVALLPHVFKEWFPWQLKYNQVLQTQFAADDEDVDAVREWVSNKNPENDVATRWGRESLSEEAGEAFDNIASSQEISDMLHARFPKNRYTVSLLPELNEVAVTGSADAVYPKHLHAPYVVYPLASVFQCVVAVSDNTEITDHFELMQRPLTAHAGDCFAFDFNREIHYVTHDVANRNVAPRVVMKLHYVVYNTQVRPLGLLLGFLTVKYSQFFAPENLGPALSHVLYFLSYLFALVEERLGFCNIAYMWLLWQLNALHPSFLVFGTSYVHYFRYMNTYHHASRAVSAGRFRRDAFLYKSCAMLWLSYYYTNKFDIRTFEPDFLSLAVAAVGFSISSLAMKALGMDATYFGVELDVAKPRWITDFPYGVVPHPMIVGQIIGILGLYISAQFRQQAPWMALGHVGLYLVHMVQENYFLPSKYGKSE